MSPSYQEFVQIFEHAPTSEQERVIRSTSPSILVIAGAGSGKTATMAQRIVWQVADGYVRPEEVLGLTFTRKAAGELAERVNSQLWLAGEKGLIRRENAAGSPDSTQALGSVGIEVADSVAEADELADRVHAATERPTISTYNSFAAEIAGSYAMLIGEDPRARLISDAERWQIMHDIVAKWPSDTEGLGDAAASTVTASALALASSIIDNALDVDTVRQFLLSEADIIERTRQARIRSKTGTEEYKRGDALAKGAPASLRERAVYLNAVEKYFEFKKENSLIEFADQVAWATRILERVPEVGEELRQRYKLILLDEYQDTSINQAAFLHAAFGSATSVCAVGDPNQAIYSWRGASANALSDFARAFNVREILTLSTAFRNSIGILDAANELTQGKLVYPGLDIKRLNPRPGADAGEVVRIHRHLRGDGYGVLARRLKEEFAKAKEDFIEGQASGRIDAAEKFEFPTAAILCRKTRYINDLLPYLEAEGLPFEVIGGESIIVKPEIRTLRALLGVVVRPGRNDHLARLFNHFAIGTADIRAFSRFAKQMAGVAAEDLPGAELSDDRPEVFYAEALTLLDGTTPPNGSTAADGATALDGTTVSHPITAPAGLSRAGYERLTHIAALLSGIRVIRHLPIPDIITRAVQLLDLNAYAAARNVGGARVRSAIDSFIRMGGQYAADNHGATLSAFLDWTDEVEKRERGGEAESSEDAELLPEEDVEPEAGVVQILTVHAAKGLEWDIVAIPEMVFQQFDAIQARIDKWPTSKRMLPYPLRTDRDHLPRFSAATFESDHTYIEDPRDLKVALGEAFCAFDDALIAHTGNEERRLAYVAVTRPRRLLLLLTYDLRDEKSAKKIFDDENKGWKGGPHSDENVFITDMTARLTTDEHVRFTSREDFESWAEESGISTLPSGTLQLEFDDDEVRYWPSGVDRSLDRRPPVSTKEIAPPAINSSVVDELVERWELQLELLENEAKKVEQERGLVRDYLTASDVVAMAANPTQFFIDQRRPIPTKSSHAARRGTFVHAAIAHHFDAPAMLDIDSVADPDEMPFGVDLLLTDKRSSELFARFESSRFAQCPPLAIERSLEIQLAGYPIRCVIDAVLDTSGISGARAHTIVDWKTGRRPDEVESRELQLGLYRLAWSRAHGVPLAEVDACFYFLGEEDGARRELRAGDLTEKEIEELIRRNLAEEGATRAREGAARV